MPEDLIYLKDASGCFLWLTFAAVAATSGPIRSCTLLLLLLLLSIHDFLLQRHLVSIVFTTVTTDELSLFFFNDFIVVVGGMLGNKWLSQVVALGRSTANLVINDCLFLAHYGTVSVFV